MANTSAIERFAALIIKSSQLNRNTGAMIGLPLSDAIGLLAEIRKLEDAAVAACAVIENLVREVDGLLDQRATTTAIDGGSLR